MTLPSRRLTPTQRARVGFLRWGMSVYSRRLLPRLVPPGFAPALRQEARALATNYGPVPCRVTWPASDPPPAGYPVYVMLHSGGYTLGGASDENLFARHLAAAAGRLIVAVDYRLAPEHPFPAALIDCHAVLQRCLAPTDTRYDDLPAIDSARVAVGGTSAGATLAAACCLLARDRAEPLPECQLLDCGGFGTPESPDPGPDPDAHRDAFTLAVTRRSALTPGLMQLFRAAYLPDPADRRNPYAAPLYAPDLRGLPPALLICAERDALRPSGEAFAARLRDAEVAVELRVWRGVDHAFTHMGPWGAAGEAWAIIAKRLRGDESG